MWSILYIPSHSDFALSVCQGGPFETEEQAMTWFRENQGTEFDIDEDRVYLMSPDHRMQELSSSDCDKPTV